MSVYKGNFQWHEYLLQTIDFNRLVKIEGLAKRGLTFQPHVRRSIVEVGFDIGVSNYENVIASNAAKIRQQGPQLSELVAMARSSTLYRPVDNGGSGLVLLEHSPWITRRNGHRYKAHHRGSWTLSIERRISADRYEGPAKLDGRKITKRSSPNYCFLSQI
jgi:hypothetical protein